MKTYQDIELRFTPEKRNLLTILHAIQDSNKTHRIEPEDIAWVTQYLNTTQAQVYGVISYYSMFGMQGPVPGLVRVCNSVICYMKHQGTLAERLKNILPGENFRVETCECLGYCHEAPVVMLNGTVITGINDNNIYRLTSGDFPPHTEMRLEAHPLEMRRVLEGLTNLPDGLPRFEPYRAFQNARLLSPSDIIQMIIDSGLKGRGGAGFPAGMKHRFTAQSREEQQTESYVVCNADEGEPGTFKDRIIMEYLPHRFIEGMLISARATGASKGFIYIRGEYVTAVQRIDAALKQARDAGYIGKDNPGGFDIEMVMGAGSYLCGEELTLLESIEGKRGHPRIKPPFPAEKGLFGKPTLISNVETFANLPWILLHGVEEYRKVGTSSSTGTKLFALSGDVQRAGYVSDLRVC